MGLHENMRDFVSIVQHPCLYCSFYQKCPTFHCPNATFKSYRSFISPLANAKSYSLANKIQQIYYNKVRDFNVLSLEILPFYTLYRYIRGEEKKVSFRFYDEIEIFIGSVTHSLVCFSFSVHIMIRSLVYPYIISHYTRLSGNFVNLNL